MEVSGGIMLTEQQLKERLNYIGSSDAAAVLGLSRWSTPLKVWAEKTGQCQPEDLSKKMQIRVGNKLEQAVADFFTEETGKKTELYEDTIYHPKYKFLAANLDRKVIGEDAFLECKTASARVKNDWTEDEIPPEYLIQVYHQLAVTGMERGYICVLIGNEDLFTIKILCVSLYLSTVSFAATALAAPQLNQIAIVSFFMLQQVFQCVCNPCWGIYQ